MTDALYTKYRPVETKKAITIRLSEDMLKTLEEYLIIAKGYDPKWNRSKLIDAILFDYMFSNGILKKTNESNKMDSKKGDTI